MFKIREVDWLWCMLGILNVIFIFVIRAGVVGISEMIIVRIVVVFDVICSIKGV